MKTFEEGREDRKGTRYVMAAALVLLPLIYFLPILIQNLTLVPGDGLTQNLGVRVLIGQMLRAGQAPLWNPYIFAGTPLLASIYPGALYPPNWVFALFSPATAMNIVVITTYHLALIGTYLYARRIGVTRIGALIAGLAFSFGGYMIAHMGHTSRIAAAVWLPWILLAIEHLYLQWSWRWIALGAAFIALQLFAGEPQMNFYTVLVGGAYGVFSLMARERRETRRRFLAGTAVMSVCGILLSMIQLLPERELLKMGERAGISYEYFSGYSFPPLHVFTFVFPFFFGGGSVPSFRVPYWGGPTLDETCGYFGLLTLLLALAALFGRRWMDREPGLIWFWAGVAVFSLLLSFGKFLPFGLNYVLYRTPVYNLFRASGRHMLEFTFSLAMLAGLGASVLARVERSQAWLIFKRSLLVFAAILFATVLSYRFLSGSFSAYVGGEVPPGEGFSSLTNPKAVIPLLLALFSVAVMWLGVWRRNTLTATLLVVMVFADLAVFGWVFNYGWRDFMSQVNERLQDPPAVQFIKARESELNAFSVVSYAPQIYSENYHRLNAPNVSIARGLQSVNGYDALRLLRQGAVSGEMGSDGLIGDNSVFGYEHQGFNLLNVKYLLNEKDSAERPHRTMEIEGVRFNRERVYQSMSTGLPGAAGKNLDIDAGGVTASELVFVTLMANATHVPDGAAVLKIRIHAKDGRVFDQELQAGRDTAEWAYDSPDVKTAVKHRRPKVAETEPADGFAANRYLARLPFQRAQVERIELEYALPDADLLILRASLFDTETGTSFPLDAVDFLSRRWRKLATFEDVAVYENQTVRPRAWFVHRLAVQLAGEVLQTIKTGKLSDGSPFNPAETALLEKEDFGNRPITLPELGDPASATVKLVRSEPNRIEIETRNPANGFLCVSEIYYRGWEAWLDGRRVPVEKVNYILRGVTVPAGEHRLEFVFRAHSFRNGAAWSAFGLVLLLAGGVVTRWRLRGK